MRKIFVVIERRADYSRYKPILKLLQKDPFFKIHLVVTGINLLKEHGEDIAKIEKDGFKINATLPMFRQSRPDSGAEMVRSMGRFMMSVVDELEAAKPDIVLTGFDIGANLATSIAAAHMNLPVAHIQGGEITGSIDESIRHAMSKFAHIHFPATKMARNRLIKMGENPKRIFVVGCPSLDVLLDAPIIKQSQLESELKIDLSKPTVVVIQHPVTTENNDSLRQIKKTIQAINEVGVQALFLLPNNDAGYSQIIAEIKKSNHHWLPSLSVEQFANLYRYVGAIVGNSSSGIHEAATFKVPAVNIGTRQSGRERGKNVLDADYDEKQIAAALKKALFDQHFIKSLQKITNRYGDGKAASKIVKVLKTIKLSGLVQKKFYE